MPAGIHGKVDGVAGKRCGRSDETEAKRQNRQSVYTLAACSEALSGSGWGFVMIALAIELDAQDRPA